MEDILFKNIILGSILLIVFCLMKIFPPKKINSIYGYRTSQSMKSQENWDKANSYSAKLGIYIGLLSIAVGISTTLIYAPYSSGITAGFTILSLIYIFFKTEKHLKNQLILIFVLNYVQIIYMYVIYNAIRF